MPWAPDAYVTRDQVKDYLHVESNAHDDFIDLWITTVSRNIDDHCNRQFGQCNTAEERWYPTVWDRVNQAYFAQIDDLQDVTDLAFEDCSGTAVAAADYQLLPRNAATRRRPYERVKLTSWSGGELTATGLWGWTEVPSSVKAAMFLQAARLAARQDSPFGISGSPSEQGEIRLLAQLDPDFRTSLKPFVRRWWAS
jgi:hypothetical protein